jgi:DNA-dependent RNA polymerase auxiliary subunit epsilon
LQGKEGRRVDKEAAGYKKEIIKKMKNVGTYNISFIYTIDTLAKVLADYEKTTGQFQATGGNIIVRHTNKNGSTNAVKNPLYLAIEKLRDDIITYSRELGLTPAGLKRINQEGNAQPAKLSKLDEVMEAIRRE